MNRTLVETITKVTLPKELVQLFADPPLVGNEKREDYDQVFSAIVDALQPTEKILWFLVKDLADLTWDIVRERKVKVYIIRSFEIVAVEEALASSDALGLGSDVEARQWATDPKMRIKIDKKLLAAGFSSSEIQAKAFIRGGREIDIIDRRIATYELRRMAILRQIEEYNGKRARQLERASSQIIEGEFSDGSEKSQ
jgi:hypothetical protein